MKEVEGVVRNVDPVGDSAATGPNSPSAPLTSVNSFRWRYGAWTIELDPPPIPVRCCDYQFWHDDYDGPEDRRCGSAASVEAACAEIDDIEDDDA